MRGGESLWSIAAAALPPGASQSRIARLVDQLWRLNAQAIPSGAPSVLAVGQKLQMPQS